MFKFDFDCLKAAILEDEKNDNLAILKNTPTDILVDDFCLDKLTNYHMVKPAVEWLKGRIVWAPSIVGNKEEWAEYIAKYLLLTDPAMLVCLNRIIITTEDESDIEAICDEMDAEDCEFPDIEGYVGLTWHFQNSVIINLTAIDSAEDELMDGFESKACMQYRDFFTTLLHEIRHLGLDCNPYLPEDEFPEELRQEYNVERWAINEFESIFA